MDEKVICPNLECLLLELEILVNDFCLKYERKNLTRTEMLEKIAQNVPVHYVAGGRWSGKK